MNIFVLDADPWEAAKLHHDRHVVKMVLETAQLLSTVARLEEPTRDFKTLYKVTHQHHPCVSWLLQGKNNKTWTIGLFMALCNEYRHRYGRIHACEKLESEIKKALGWEAYASSMPSVPPAQCMPDKYKRTVVYDHSDTNTHVYTFNKSDLESVVAAYRDYYKNEKVQGAKWTKRNRPAWV